MKLSSISLIAAALAATASCAIAAPCPLSACALEQLNSFQPDLDVHHREAEDFALERNVEEPVDNLVTRGGVSNAEAAFIIRSSASLHRKAAAMADEAGENAPGSWTGQTKQQWEEEGRQLTKDADKLSEWHRKLEATPAGIPNQRHMEYHLVHVVAKNAAVKLTATRAHNDIHHVKFPSQGGHPSH